MPSAVPLERAWTIGMPLTTVVTSEWVWPLTMRSGLLGQRAGQVHDLAVAALPLVAEGALVGQQDHHVGG